MAQTLVFDTQTNSYQAIFSDLAAQAFSNPRYQVPINDPDGNLVTTNYLDAQNLLSKNVGYSQPSQMQLNALLQSSIYNTPEERLKGFGENLARGAIPFGLGTEALVKLGDTPENMRQRQMFQPGWLKFAGETTGLIGSEFIPGGQARLMEKTGLGALKLLGLGVKEGEALSLAQKMGRGALKEAMEFGLLGAGDTISNMIIQDPQATTESAIAQLSDGILTSTIVGGLFGAAKPVIAAPFKFAGTALENTLKKIQEDSDPDKMGNELQLAPLFKKFLSVVGGPSVENQEKLIKYNELINAENAETFEQVYEHYLNYIKDLDEKVLNKKLNSQEYEQKIAKIKNEIKSKIKDQVQDVNLAYDKTEQLYKDFKKESLKDIRTNAVAQDQNIFDALADIKEKAFNAAENAMNVLIETGEKVDVMPVINKIEREIETRYQQANPLSRQIGEYLENHLDLIISDLEDPLSVSAQKAKLILRGIGEEGYTKGARNPKESELASFYRGLYRDFSDKLKDQFPKYAKEVKPAADLMAIINSLDKFGYKDLETIRTKIGNLIVKDGLQAEPQIKVLKELEKNSEKQFVEALETYLGTTKNKDFKQSDAYQALKLAEELSLNFEKIKSKVNIDQLLNNTETVETLNKAIQKLNLSKTEKQLLQNIIKTTDYIHIKAQQKEANKALAEVMAQREGIKNLTQENIQPFLQRAMKEKDIKTMATLEKLPKMNEKELKTILQAINVRQQFEKGFMHGSRQVQGWKTIMATLLGAKFGGPLGVLVGWSVDKYGPAITKELLDNYVKMFGDLTTESGVKNASAMRLMMYKFLSGGAPVKGEEFKAGIKYLDAAIQGQQKITKKINDSFDPAIKVATVDLITEEKKRKEFEKKLTQLNPQQMIENPNQISYYMPDHGVSLVQTMAKVGSYLKQQYPQGPLIAGKQQISFIDQTKFNRSVDIARNPLIILDHFKQGNLIPKDIIDLNAMYPNLLKNIQNQFTEKLIDLKMKNQNLTETQKIGLSILFDQPMGRGLIPNNIVQAQSPFMSSLQKVNVGSLKALKKLPSLEQTQGQKAEAQ